LRHPGERRWSDGERDKKAAEKDCTAQVSEDAQEDALAAPSLGWLSSGNFFKVYI